MITNLGTVLMVRAAEDWSRLYREVVESSFLEIIQKLTGHNPEQPAVADPALTIVGRLLQRGPDQSQLLCVSVKC